jgi:hypothetical protein
MGAGSVPFVNWLCLISYRDLTEALGQGTFSYLSTMAISVNDGAGGVLATYLLAVAGYAGAAAWFTRAAWNRFDRAADRPQRTTAFSRYDSAERFKAVSHEALRQHRASGFADARQL